MTDDNDTKQIFKCFDKSHQIEKIIQFHDAVSIEIRIYYSSKDETLKKSYKFHAGILLSSHQPCSIDTKSYDNLLLHLICFTKSNGQEKIYLPQIELVLADFADSAWNRVKEIVDGTNYYHVGHSCVNLKWDVPGLKALLNSQLNLDFSFRKQDKTMTNCCAFARRFCRFYNKKNMIWAIDCAMVSLFRGSMASWILWGKQWMDLIWSTQSAYKEIGRPESGKVGKEEHESEPDWDFTDMDVEGTIENYNKE